MATRFASGGNWLKMTSNLLPASGFDVCFWAKRRATSANGTFWAIENGTSSASTGLWVELDPGGTVLGLNDSGATRITGPTMTVDVWYFFFLSVVGTNSATLWYAEERAKDLSSGTAATLNVTFTPAQMAVGSDSYDPSDRADVVICNLMHWTRNHDQGFANEQRLSYQPLDRQRLHSWFPMDSGLDAKEEGPSFDIGKNETSGGGLRWTLTGTLTTEPGPDTVILPFPAPAPVVFAPAAANNQGAPSCSPADSFAATGAALKAGAGASSPADSFAATGAALKAGAAASSPTDSFAATGASKAAGAGASSPADSFAVTGKALAAGAPSCSPTLAADAVTSAASSLSCSPADSFAATGKALFAGDASSAPTISATATGASKAAAASSSAPTINAAATGNMLKAAAPSCSPGITVGARSNIQHVKFPLAVSSNSRYLNDAQGHPFRLQVDSAWEVCTMPVLTDWRQYLDDRVGRGFNAAVIQMTDSLPNSGRPNPASNGAGGALPFLKNASGGNWDGDPGFTNHDADWSTPNDTYWDWIETVVSEACARGVYLLANPCYLGINFGTEGWYQTLINSANTQTVCFNFGVYLGNRFKNYHNIMWIWGGDMTPTASSEGETRLHKILEGIASTGDTGLNGAHWAPESVSTDVAAFASDMDVRNVYTYGSGATSNPKYPKARTAYGASPTLPVFEFETTYEGEHSVTTKKMREFMWTLFLSSTAGVTFGNNPVWIFATGWQAALASTGAQMIARMATFLSATYWQELVPRGLGGIGTLVTAGGGTSGNDDYVTAAAAGNKTILIAFVPDSHTGSVTIDCTALGAPFNARWFDPTNASFTSIGGSPFTNTGTQAFTTPGTNNAGDGDWVLFLEALNSGDASSAPADSFAATAKALFAALASSAPSITAGATGASKAAAAASCSPILNANATPFGIAGPTPPGWHPDWWREGWLADFYGGL